jgi:hypothetical protein
MRKNVSLSASVALGVLVACVAAALTAGPGAGRRRRRPSWARRHRLLLPEQRQRHGEALGQHTGDRLTLGDNVYPYGSAENFRDCYDPTWGKHKKRTKPSLGNHEYYDQNYNMTTAAGPYFDYFGARAGARGEGYYSYDRGAWHIVALNSNCGMVGGCESDSPQGRWLRNDLANNANHQCTMAYFHRPLYSTGTNVAGPRRQALLEDAPRPRRRPDRQRARPPLRALRPDDPDGARSDATASARSSPGPGGPGAATRSPTRTPRTCSA